MLSELLALFLESLRGQSRANLRLYRQRLAVFVALYGSLSPAALSPGLVNAWYRQVDDGRRGPATLAGYRQAVKAFTAWMLREGLLTIDPARHLRAGRYISTRPRVPSDLDMSAALRVAGEWLTGSALQRRDAALFMLAVETGGRVGGLCALRLVAVHLALAQPDQNGVYAVVTASKGRDVLLEFTYISARAVLAWLEMRPGLSSSGRLFCSLSSPFGAMSSELACRGYERISRAAGVPTITSHALRHRVGTLYTQVYDPKVAALKLGHADAATTAATAIAYYYRPDRGVVSAATAALAPGREQTIHNRLPVLVTPNDS